MVRSCIYLKIEPTKCADVCMQSAREKESKILPKFFPEQLKVGVPINQDVNTTEGEGLIRRLESRLLLKKAPYTCTNPQA